ncbi:MAG: ASKHA domain-containing protein [Thermofilaceae archaeon]|nr:ASKHA domain-containing protein [Thermofilaceae archaeon]
MPKLTVKHVRTFDVDQGETVLEALRRHGITLAAGCGGLGLCGLCKVKVETGHLTPPTSREIKLLSEQLAEGWRLACQAKLAGDTRIEVPLKRTLTKFRAKTSMKITPPAVFVPFELSTGDPSYEEELLTKLGKVGLKATRLSPSALNFISERFSGIAVIVGDEIVDITDTYAGYGLAVDIGTTSIAASLVDLSSGDVIEESVELNSQLKFGADVISRIRQSIQEENVIPQLQEAAVDTVNSLINKFNVPPSKIYRVTVAGNSVMLHLFYGISPKPLGFLPFRPVYRRSLLKRGWELGLDVNPQAPVESLPILGGYIGGDVVGDILAAQLWRFHTAMLIDVGTNGEIVLKHGERYVAASTPAGPAFEGVGLYSGMMAVEGAIERVSLHPRGGVSYQVIGGGEAKGICGSAYVDLLAELLRNGLLTRGGKLVPGPHVKEYNGMLTFVLDDEKNILLTQRDIRKLQLAVAAVKFTAKFLLKHVGVGVDNLEKLVVAGDFGYHLDLTNAMEIGLLPKVSSDIVEYIGNGSLTGAELYMTSDEARSRAVELLNECKVLDTPRDDRAFIAELELNW